MSLVSTDEINALMGTGLEGDPASLQRLIDREEAWLARRIGKLIGARTQRILRFPGDLDAILITRPTDAVTVTAADGGAPVPVVLIGSARLEPVNGSWPGPVDIAFAPTDLDEVTRVVVELVRIATRNTPFQAESGGSGGTGGYQRGRDPRVSLLDDLNPHRGPMSTTTRSGFVPDRISP